MPKYLPSGMRGLVLTPAEYRLAASARAVRRGADVLYHGTRYSQQILSEGALMNPDWLPDYVSLTRSPEVAAFSAWLPRGQDGRPAILVLDRRSLRTRYPLHPYHDVWRGHRDQMRDEAEERVPAHVLDLHRYLLAVVQAS